LGEFKKRNENEGTKKELQKEKRKLKEKKRGDDVKLTTRSKKKRVALGR